MMFAFLKKLFRPAPRVEVCFAGRTDTGRKRSVNEDGFAILAPERVMLVADGMGGHKAGDVASRQAIGKMTALIRGGGLRQVMESREAARHFLVKSLHAVNEHVMALAAGSAARDGMGCTFIAAVIHQDTLLTCHVGDVRAYLLSGGGIRRLTRDHTYAAEYDRMVREDPESARAMVKPARNIVSRAVGFAFAEDPECHEESLADGDVVLLCSDGLWNMVPDKAIAAIVRRSRGLDAAACDLIAAANEAGGHDNITVALASVRVG